MPQVQLKERSPTTLRTLILNADGRPLATWPLNLISAADAVTAAWLDKAIVVEEWPGAFFRSSTTTIAVPKTMMLRQYARVGQNPKFCRASIYLRDHYTCQFCGKRFDRSELTFDHLVPRSEGGETTWSNILTACLTCNAQKGNRSPVKSGMFPLSQPRQPSTSELLRSGLKLLPNDIREDFGSWLYWSVELKA